MRPYKLPALGILITVTDTSTLLTDLINTAAGTSIEFDKTLNFALLHPKDGAVLVLFDGNDPDNTTTPVTGIEVFQNDQQQFKGAPLNDLRLQRKNSGGSDVETVVQIGWTDAQGN